MDFRAKQAVRAARSYIAASASGPGEVRLAVFVGAGSPPWLVGAVRAALVPSSAGSLVHVAGFGAGSALPAVNASADAALILVGSDLALAAIVAAGNRAAGVPCAALVDESDPQCAVACLDSLARGGADGCAVLSVGPSTSASDLAGWLLDSLPDSQGALAAGFSCCAREASLRATLRAGRDNALVAGRPGRRRKGSDAPAMRANEASVAAGIACSSGGFSPSSLIRDAGLIAAATLAGKHVARGLSKRLPLPSRLVNVGVAYATTVAVGLAMRAGHGLGAAEAAHTATPFTHSREEH